MGKHIYSFCIGLYTLWRCVAPLTSRCQIAETWQDVYMYLGLVIICTYNAYYFKYAEIIFYHSIWWLDAISRLRLSASRILYLLVSTMWDRDPHHQDAAIQNYSAIFQHVRESKIYSTEITCWNHWLTLYICLLSTLYRAWGVMLFSPMLIQRFDTNLYSVFNAFSISTTLTQLISWNTIGKTSSKARRQRKLKQNQKYSIYAVCGVRAGATKTYE